MYLQTDTTLNNMTCRYSNFTSKVRFGTKSYLIATPHKKHTFVSRSNDILVK